MTGARKGAARGGKDTDVRRQTGSLDVLHHGKLNKAIFLDRDGTIIRDKGFIKHPKKIEFYDYAFDSLRELQREYLLFIITNQAGVAKGIINLREVEETNEYILHMLKSKGVAIRQVYYCPHSSEDNCSCKKPKTYFVDEAREQYRIDLRSSFVIGDHPSDVQLAINVGAQGIYLLTGHGRKHLNEIPISIQKRISVCRNLKYAARLILSWGRTRAAMID